MHQGFEELHEAGSRTADNVTKSAREYVDRLLPWLKEHQEVPFFVFLHVFDPHSPFTPRPPYDSLWADPAKTAAFEKDLDSVREFIETATLRDRGMPSRDEILKAGVEPGAVHRSVSRLVRRLDSGHGRGNRTAPGRAPGP